MKKDMKKARECCKKVREDLTYSDTCVFEGEWKDAIGRLLERLRSGEES